MTYFWKHTKRYNDFSTHFKNLFTNRVQKIAINAGFTCPNRDGSKSRGGCTYCNNETFNPFYCAPEKSITQQINEGIAFFSEKYKTQKYLAYFQAYSNTYAPLHILEKLYNEALSHSEVIGLVIATRPDCISQEIVNLLKKLSEKHYITLELGVETTQNETLTNINRCHTFEDTVNALNLLKNTKIHTGIHLILGLPCESYETLINHAKIISTLPFETLKLHQLQIIRKTIMAKQYETNPEKFSLFTAENYIELVIDFMERLSPQIIIERFTSESPADLLIAPKWGSIKNYEMVAKIEKRMEERKTWQGKFFSE